MFLLAIIVGSGIMGDSLSGGNVAVALLGNTIATGAGLFVLITIFRPISGAHFNPAVTLVFWLLKQISLRASILYISTQIIAGMSGVIIAHAMFDLDLLQLSDKERSGAGKAISEFIATFGLVITILSTIRFRPEQLATAVGLFITAGYWFTASTSFANPAVSIARALTNTFAGIHHSDVPIFIGLQLFAAICALGCARWLFSPRDGTDKTGYSQSNEKRSKAALSSAR